jgi:enoyl-CoA hydratase/carnithine racemase
MDLKDLKTILLERDGQVATVTLNRPHRMNAWTGRMHTEYRHVLKELDDDEDVRVIVVTGAGRAFCAGADTAALEGHSEKGRYDPGTPDELAEPGFGVRPEFDANFAYQFGLKKPVIAAVNGAAAGVGLVIACFADLRFAAEGAKMTTAHGRFNLPAEFGLSWLLPRLIGLTHANDLLLSSRVFLAEEGGAMGLFNKVVPRDDLLPCVMDYARNLVDAVSPGSLKQTKWQVYTDLHRDAASAVKYADRLLEEMVQHPNYKIGLKAFMKKEKADWSKD